MIDALTRQNLVQRSTLVYIRKNKAWWWYGSISSYQEFLYKWNWIHNSRLFQCQFTSHHHITQLHICILLQKWQDSKFCQEIKRIYFETALFLSFIMKYVSGDARHSSVDDMKCYSEKAGSKFQLCQKRLGYRTCFVQYDKGW